MPFETRPARPEDAARIVALLPRLADYELPTNRSAEMFWSSDAELVERWATGAAPETHIRVGVDDRDAPIAVGMITIGSDTFSKAVCAHLEVIVLHTVADGSGLGRVIIGELEDDARSLGASIMSLHVLGNNTRARHVYQKLGYDEELIRAVKFLQPAAD